MTASAKLTILGCLLFALIWGISAETTFASTQAQTSTGCTIPPSGPWPPCATGGSTTSNPTTCVIPPSGPWPSCATSKPAVENNANPAACTIPTSGPWPTCATNGTAAAPPTTQLSNQLTTFTTGDIDPDSIATQHGSTYFIRLDANNNRTLWVTDGTSAGTQQFGAGQLKPLAIAPCQTALVIVSENATWSVNQHGWLLKLADKRLSGGFDHQGNCYLWHGQGNIVTPGTHELWRTNGSAQGTKLIFSRFSGGGGFHSFKSTPNGQFVFAHTNNAGSSSTYDIMISDGESVRRLTRGWGIAGVTNNAVYTKWYGAKGSCGAGIVHAPDGTRRFQFSNSTPAEIGTINNYLLYFAPDTNCYSGPYYLWRSDGTEAGTIKLLSSEPSAGIAYKNNIYFVRQNEQGVVALWRTNGTQQGTQFVKAIPMAQSVAHLNNFQIVDEMLYFTVGDGNFGITLWQSDGTVQNTKQFSKIWQSDSESTYRFGRMTLISDGNALYLRGNADNTTPQLWRLPLDDTTAMPDTPATSCVIPPTGPWPACAR